MYFVYILQSLKDKRTYIGYSNDYKRRLFEHNNGKSKSTKHRRPLELIYLENFEDESAAKARELYWKSGAGRRKMKLMFENKK